MKRQLIKWEKIFINHVSDKGLISRIYKELLKLNNKKPSLKMDKILEINISPNKMYKQPIST